jgi:Sulfotransferase family
MLPNFLVVGAAKAGTTSLWDFLRRHPQVYMPSGIKETNFFALEGTGADYKGPGDDYYVNRLAITDRATYEGLFEGVTDQVAVGEVTPIYMCHPDAPPRIKACIPGVKIIAILRNPVDRAFSSYLHLVRDGRESLDFAAALGQETERVAANWEPLWHLKELGLYYKQLSHYYELFDSRQIRVYLFEELIGNRQATLADLMQFLGIDADVEIEFKKTNSASQVTITKSRFLSDLVFKDNVVKQAAKRILPTTFIRKAKDLIVDANTYKPTLAPSVRRELAAFFREDIKHLEKLIDRDLSSWTDT